MLNDGCAARGSSFPAPCVGSGEHVGSLFTACHARSRLARIAPATTSQMLAGAGGPVFVSARTVTPYMAQGELPTSTVSFQRRYSILYHLRETKRYAHVFRDTSAWRLGRIFERCSCAGAPRRYPAREVLLQICRNAQTKLHFTGFFRWLVARANEPREVPPQAGRSGD